MGRKKLDMASMARLREMSAAGTEQTKIARELGVSRQCVQYQQGKPENAEAIAERREELAAMCESVAVRSLGFISDSKLQASSAAQLSIVAATQLDKASMLRGNTASAPIINIVIRDPRLPFKVEASDNEGQPQTIEINPAE